MDLRYQKAVGFVESLIALAIVGVLMLAILGMTMSVLREITQNELRTEATQEADSYLEIVRAIRDAGWGTVDSKPPRDGDYVLCFKEEDQSTVLCQSEADGLNFYVTEYFVGNVHIDTNDTKDFVTVRVDIVCEPGYCKNIDYSLSVVLKTTL